MEIINTKYIEKEIKYTGKELCPMWITRNFKLFGNSIVLFAGECDVPVESMIDLEDVLTKSNIYSKRMLHLIGEFFSFSIGEAVFLQRLIICIIGETIEEMAGIKIRRSGDDLFIGNRKLSVSIAGKSVMSCLIHIGINIDPEGAPVDAIGLEEIKINEKEFGKLVLMRIKEEINSAEKAKCKVLPLEMAR